MKLPLDKPKKRSPSMTMVWTEALPFVKNDRGVLIHRPRRVVQYRISDRWKPHFAVNYWCGAGTTGRKHIHFLDVPESGALLCSRCEDVAVAKGYPPADEICGKHIHIGRVVPEQMCHQIDRYLGRQQAAKAFDDKYGTPCEQIRKAGVE